MMKDFFISYNSNDKQWAEWIARTLEAAGYTTIIQAWDFRPGENFVLKMQKATTGTNKTIAVLSQNYLDAAFTHPEWANGFRRDPQGNERTLIPMRIDNCKPGGLLASIIYADLYGLDEDEACQTLISALADRAKPDGPAPFPGDGKNQDSSSSTADSSKETPDGPTPFPGDGKNQDSSSSTADSSKETLVKIVIDEDFDTFTPSDQHHLLRALGELLKTNRKIQISSSRAGSVILILILETHEAQGLLDLFHLGLLRHLNIRQVEILDSDSVTVNKAHSINWESLSGPQQGEFVDALLSAHGSRSSLEQVLRFELDERLDKIAGSGNMVEVTAAVVTWAVDNGKAKALFEGARERNKGNPALKALEAKLLNMVPAAPQPKPESTTTPQSTDSENAQSSTNTTTAGERGVAIGGNVSGGSVIITGDGNQISLPPSNAPFPGQDSSSSTGGGALKIWREKLDFLRQQEAIIADPAQKFSLKKQIEEAEAKIQALS